MSSGFEAENIIYQNNLQRIGAAQGSILASNSSSIFELVVPSANDQVLVSDSAESSGTKWAVSIKSYGSLYYRNLASTTFPSVIIPTILVTSSTPILAPIDTATYPTTLGISSGDFDMPVQARIRYTGTQTKTFLITVDLDGYTSTGSPPAYYIAINGVANLDTTNVIATTVIYLDRSISLIFPLSTNDYVEVYVSKSNNENVGIATNKQNIFIKEV